MTTQIQGDLTGLQDFPKYDEQIPGSVPAGGLLAFWRDTLVTLNGGNVSSWTAYGSYTASNADADQQPAYSSGDVTFDGVDDVLITDVAVPAEGYLAVRCTPVTVGGGGTNTIVGQQENSTNRLYIANNNSGTVGAAIGDESASALAAAGAPATGVDITLGLHWTADGAAQFRRNGTQEDAGVWNSSGGGLGSLNLNIGANNFGGSPAQHIDWTVRAVVLYGQAGGFSLSELSAIDAALALL